MQRLRLRYAKRGRLRFTSHRDFSRAFERALIRARIPMAMSSGFNPHPRISYAGAAPTGAASEAEYVEIGLKQVCDPAEVLALLDAAMPPGLDVVEVVASTGGSLADLLQASIWQIDLDLPVEPVEEMVASFLAADLVEVERMTKRGLRVFDARQAVLSLSVESIETGSRITLLLRHAEPAVRPDDVLAGLSALSGIPLGSGAAGVRLTTRIAQGILDESAPGVRDPLR